MGAVKDVTFLELFRDHVDEIRELIGADSPDFMRDAQTVLLQISEAATADDVNRLVAELIELAQKTGAGDLIRRLNLEAGSLTPPIHHGATTRSPLELKLQSDAVIAGRSAAATLSEWLTPTRQYLYRSVPVFFATDRMPSGDDNPNKFFGGEPGPLRYGNVRVSVPDRHEVGQIERPWKLFPESPAKHVTLLGLQTSTTFGFLENVKSALESTAFKKLLIFVHGYNVPFADAARVMAQITVDFNFQVIPVIYSWPSRGKFWGYTSDEASATRTREHFVETLNSMHALQSEQHLLAHSMGSRIAFQGLQLVEKPRFKQVILAAPDEDADTLGSQLHRFLGHAERNTVYSSTRDNALRLSRWLHGASRGGQTGVAGFDSIDASVVNFSRFGHSYFHDQRSLLNDIFLVVEHGLPPDRRPSIRRSTDGSTWEFQR
jgi:esterase/lipase superfamily enzyme